MQVFFQIVAFSLQKDGSGWPVFTKGKHVKSNSLFCVPSFVLQI